MASTAPKIFESLFGKTLATKDGEKPTLEALAGKSTVGIYFSAHWCPPCRGFTPQLAKNYTNHYKAKGMEIVFVSSDRDEESFKSYFAEQPWLALPYAERDTKGALSKKFKVQGIPTFVILDGATGEVITTDGRESVGEDPEGKDYPWKPPTLWEALGDEFLQGTEGETVSLEEVGKGVEGKVIGLYFSAHWCPPCRGFTPKLVDAYTSHLKAKGLEMIFVSSDKDTASFTEYYKTMPWLAIPHGDPRKGKLSKLFGVSGIPSLVLIDAATGKTINGNARGKITSDPEGKEFPYWPKPLNDMVAEGPGDINETPTLCAMMEGCSEAAVEAALKALEPIAKAAVDKEEEMAFLYARKEGGPTKQIRELTKLGDATDKPQLMLIDIPDSGGYYVSPASEITPDAVQSFLDMYKAKALERQQME